MYIVINSSVGRFALYKSSCETVNKEFRKIPYDIETRRNSTYTMLNLVIKYCLAIDALYLTNELIKFHAHQPTKMIGDLPFYIEILLNFFIKQQNFFRAHIGPHRHYNFSISRN